MSMWPLKNGLVARMDFHTKWQHNNVKIRASTVLLVAAVAAGIFAAAGCGDDDEPRPSPTPPATSTGPAGETPAATATPAATPLPTVSPESLKLLAVEVATGRNVPLGVGFGRGSAWSRDSSLVAVAGAGLAIGTTQGTPFVQLVNDECFDVEWSPVANYVAAACGERVVAFDASGKLLMQQPVARTAWSGTLPIVHWSPDGQTVAFGPVGGVVMLTRLDGALSQVGGSYTDMEWLPDGRLVSIALPSYQAAATFRIHNPEKGYSPVAEFVTPSRAYNAGIDSSGSYVAYGVYGGTAKPDSRILPSSVHVVRVADGQEVASFADAYLSEYNSPSFTSNGEELLVAMDVCGPGWSIDVGRLDGTTTRVASGGSMAMKFSPDGKQVAFTSGTTLWVVPGDGSTAPRQLAEDVHGPAGFEWSPDSRWITMPPFFGGFGQCP
jgi:hypothetical protein